MGECERIVTCGEEFATFSEVLGEINHRGRTSTTLVEKVCGGNGEQSDTVANRPAGFEKTP